MNPIGIILFLGGCIFVVSNGESFQQIQNFVGHETKGGLPSPFNNEGELRRGMSCYKSEEDAADASLKLGFEVGYYPCENGGVCLHGYCATIKGPIKPRPLLVQRTNYEVDTMPQFLSHFVKIKNPKPKHH